MGATFGQENRPFTEADLRFPTILLALLALAVPATASAAPRVLPASDQRHLLTGAMKAGPDHAADRARA